ncbi:MAG: endopeptidase La [Candidatus Latescibacteria bacterium]|nr:endopeptidase La [Candidatus Latescibacterota bacterium]
MAAEKSRQSPGEERVSIPDSLPILPSGDAVIYPYMLFPFVTTAPEWVRAVDASVTTENKMVGLFALKDPDQGPTPENLHRIGTIAVIARMLRLPNGAVQILIQGLSRIRLLEVTDREPYLKGRVERAEEQEEQSVELEALTRNAVGLFQKAISLAPNLSEELGEAVAVLPNGGAQADFIASHINLSLAERQAILEALNVTERLRMLTGFLNRELEILELGSKIQSEVKGEMDKTQRDYYLRQQLKAIQRELGEEDEQAAETHELRERIEKAGMPPEARKEADRELERMSKMPSAAAEYSVIRSYLESLITMPWSVMTEDRLDVAEAEKILDEDHYGLRKPKDRILEYLAVRKLKPDMKGPILCFAGPPGTGKTSLGQSIARALGRKFVRISLGGVHDEADIRGHRRTYIGAMPGRIIQGLRRAESCNPVFMLDEIDKMGQDFRGDPAAALLEVLDPQQNNTFLDHYLDVPFDLSKVLFITTANVIYTIPPALLDRMEVLELPGYTEPEKMEIAHRYLVPRQLAEHGLSAETLVIADDAIKGIIRHYTREAGLRNLEREIGSVCRKVAREIVRGKAETIHVSEKDLHTYLGPIRFRSEVAETSDEIGLVTGLSVTGAGGEVLFVEVLAVPGKGGFTLTGQLGDVMKESAQAAMTYIRSRAQPLGLTPAALQKLDVHIHVPAGAVPKDGPSAGVTMTTALVSALTKRPVRRDVAMTGEVTLRGKVLPVGGVRDKVLAAHRAGIRTVILPADNEKDIEDIPIHVRNDLRFVFVNHMDQVLNEALSPEVAKEKIELVAA